MDLRFRDIESAGIRFKLRPHLTEFDQEVLFARHLTYEASVFAFLRDRAQGYETIIEIGANVGAYTVFLSKIAGGAKIYAFEPSHEAFRRLKENLHENGCLNVDVFPVAVAPIPGFVPFFEPTGHLTNGSMRRDFAEIFSADIGERRAPAIPVTALEELFTEGATLLKLDVEGAEPEILRACMPLLERYAPDLLVEVLEFTEAAMNSIAWPPDYCFYELSPQGAIRHQSFRATKNRDYFLTARPKLIGLP